MGKGLVWFGLVWFIGESDKVLISFSRSKFVGPYTSVYTNTNKSLALLPLDENGLLVILPSRQGVQTGIGSIANEGKIPSFTSLSILFRFI